MKENGLTGLIVKQSRGEVRQPHERISSELQAMAANALIGTVWRSGDRGESNQCISILIPSVNSSTFNKPLPQLPPRFILTLKQPTWVQFRTDWCKNNKQKQGLLFHIFMPDEWGYSRARSYLWFFKCSMQMCWLLGGKSCRQIPWHLLNCYLFTSQNMKKKNTTEEVKLNNNNFPASYTHELIIDER